jgi:hypothetical protein
MLVMFLSFIFSAQLMAVQLSPESLFRHASNGDSESNTVSVNFLVKKISDDLGQPFYLRHIYGIEGEKIRFSQIVFDGADMNNNQVQSIFSTSNFMEVAGKNPEKDGFNITSINIFFNSSWPVMSFLKKSGIAVKHNQEAYDKEKIKILEAYKVYSKNPAGKENPLKPNDPEERKRINELLNSGLVSIPPESTKLVRKNKTNFIEITYPNFKASFTNQEHRLTEFEVNGKSHLHLLLEEYVALNGINYFPKFITINVDNEIYRLQTLNYKYGNESFVEFEKRSQALQALAKKHHKDVLVQKPHFLQ